MGAKPRKKPDETLAPKLIRKSLSRLGKVLVLVGKPAYKLISYSLIALLFLFYITGYIFRSFTESLIKIFKILTLLSKKAWHKASLECARLLKKITSRKIQQLISKNVSFSKKELHKAQRKVSKHLRRSKVLLDRKVKSLKKDITKLSKGVQKKVKAFDLLRKIHIIKSKLRLYLLRLTSFLAKIKLPKIVTAKTFITLFALILLSLFTISYSFWFFIIKDLPKAEELINRDINISTKIYDRNGELLYTIYKDENRTPIALDNIPAQVRLATIAIEDAEFYSHPGFSVRGITRAIIRNIKRGELTGGSTITQQLVKNALLSPEKTLSRKLKEIFLSIKVELYYDKDTILEMYLNEVAYGGTAYGIQEAARTYFAKDADQLTLAESALLAGLPKSPTRYSPFGPNKDFAFERQKEVLNLMHVNGFITSQQKFEAEQEAITFAANKTDIKAPHFVMYVREHLVDIYGEEVVAKGGLEVFTTLDLRMQNLAEEIVREEVEKLSSLNVGNGAALIIEPNTGDVLAMVGSKDYFDTESDGNVNITLAQRQPGSSIKVINYAFALSNNFTPATIIKDSPVTFTVSGQPPYSPRNYDNRYRGNIPLRNALAESRNIPAVRVLASYGVDKMIQLGRSMGITTWVNPSNYGLSLTLGGGEVRLIDLATVYATIANYGRRQNINPLLKVTNYEGKVLEEKKCIPSEKGSSIAEKIIRSTQVLATSSAKKIQDTQIDGCGGEQVLDPRVSYLLIDILKDNKARSLAFGSSSLLIVPGHQEVAVKTGTSNDLRDNLAIGFNQKYLVATWVGNNDNSPMSRIASGITGATPIFNKIMSAILTNEENHDWIIPDGLVQVPICPITGTLPCQGCPIRIEWFLEESQPTTTCNPDYFKTEDEIQEKDKDKDYPLLPADRQGQILDSSIRIEREIIPFP